MTHSLSASREAAYGPGKGSLDLAALDGFTYLLGQPTGSQRSTFLSNIEVARPALIGLVQALPVAPSPEAPTAASHPVWTESLIPTQLDLSIDDNPFIPAGYTYLLQFIAHDLVQTTVPLWAAADAHIQSGNARGMGLRLDTLYGGGPAICPAAYETAGNDIGDRILLRLGHINLGTASTFPLPRCQFRDLGRVNLLDAASGSPNPRNSANFAHANEVLVADRRNDDSIILAQITVLFSIVHNIISSKIMPRSGKEAQFWYARSALQCIYYNIIKNDLLPRLLHKEVYDAIKGRTADDQSWLWRSPGIPLEFAHGAFRVGHAMVRGHYRLNAGAPDKVGIVTIVQGNRSVSDARGPMPASWVVQWSQFFSDLGAVPNFSRRIGPTQSRLDHESLFPSRYGTAANGISLRDLLSAAVAQSWKVDALIQEIQIRNPELIPRAWPFLDLNRRKRMIGDWLDKISGKPNSTGLSASIAALTSDLPLPLFVLLEAALDPAVNGKSMGVLGSIIVSEVICKRLAEEQNRLESQMNVVQDALAADGFWDEIVRIRSMPDLVRFAAKHGGLGDHSEPPFI